MLFLGFVELVIVGVIAGVIGFAAGAATMAAVRRGGGGGPMAPRLPVRSEDVLRANVRDVRKGGLLHLPGFGDDYEDLDLEVERYTRFSRGRDEWHELAGTYRNRAVGLEWHLERGEPQVFLYKKLRGHTLADVGLSEERLESLGEGSHEHEGVAYRLTAAEEALSHADGLGFGKGHRTWELRSPDGARLLRIERWGEKPHQVSLGERTDPSTIQIYKVKG